jgi:hypothetical protein
VHKTGLEGTIIRTMGLALCLLMVWQTSAAWNPVLLSIPAVLNLVFCWLEVPGGSEIRNVSWP